MKSIDVKNKSNCCGCLSCLSVCPKQCISAVTDEEGFIYPSVDTNKCVLCGKCSTVCPVINSDSCKNDILNDIAYAYVDSDESIVKESSSGGAFSLIMDAFANSYTDYEIIGAAFDGIEVKHIAKNSRNEANIFRKSKYIQSNTSGIFAFAKQRLNAGAGVLFSGTPCQVAALKRFLGKEYENLLTVDIVCHGVPSQTCFDEYIQEIEKSRKSKIVSVEFRYKSCFESEKPNPRTINLIFADGNNVVMDISESEFLYAYYTGLIYRPSCAKCKFASSERPGDITLGDYWGIEKLHPKLNSLKGVSLVRFNNAKGKLWGGSFIKKGAFIVTSWEFACNENHQLKSPATPHRNREKFFKLRSKGVSFLENVSICKKPDTLIQKVIRKLRLIIN